MGKNILAAVVGYVALFAAVFVLFSVSFVVIGVERSYLPDSFNVSMLWIVVSLVLSFMAAMFGGYVCKLIARNHDSVKILAGVALILGLVMAAGPLFMEPANIVRPAEVGVMEAMSQSAQPLWAGFVIALLHVGGVFYGARLRKVGVLT